MLLHLTTFLWTCSPQLEQKVSQKCTEIIQAKAFKAANIEKESYEFNFRNYTKEKMKRKQFKDDETRITNEVANFDLIEDKAKIIGGMKYFVAEEAKIAERLKSVDASLSIA